MVKSSISIRIGNRWRNRRRLYLYCAANQPPFFASQTLPQWTKKSPSIMTHNRKNWRRIPLKRKLIYFTKFLIIYLFVHSSNNAFLNTYFIIDFRITLYNHYDYYYYYDSIYLNGWNARWKIGRNHVSLKTRREEGWKIHKGREFFQGKKRRRRRAVGCRGVVGLEKMRGVHT